MKLMKVRPDGIKFYEIGDHCTMDDVLDVLQENIKILAEKIDEIEKTVREHDG